MLKDEYPTYIPPPVEAKPKKPFVLPPASPDCRRVFRYLKERGISGEVLQRCVHLGILYESLPYHNAVFVGRDENQVARYAFLRGIYDASGKSFKMEQAGSEKAYAFCVPAKHECRRVAVYEACVDVLAHMTLEQGRMDKYRLELGGISAPKEGQSQRSMKKPQALEHFCPSTRRLPRSKCVPTMILPDGGRVNISEKPTRETIRSSRTCRRSKGQTGQTWQRRLPGH